LITSFINSVSYINHMPPLLKLNVSIDKQRKTTQAAKSSSHQLRKRGHLGRKAPSQEKKEAFSEDQEGCGQTSQQIFKLNEVYLPLVDIELLKFVYISAVLSWLWHLVQLRSDGGLLFLVELPTLSKGVTKMALG